MIWTRSEDDWESDKKLLSELPFSVLHFPCIKVFPIDYRLSEEGYNKFVITSPKAVAYAWQDIRIRSMLKKAAMVYTFGKKTRQILAEHALQVEAPAGVKGSRELAKHLERELSKEDKILVLGAVRPAFDLVHYLKECHFNADYLALYQTKPDGKPQDRIMNDHQSLIGSVVCFASPSAVNGFEQLIGEKQCLWFYEHLVAVVIGDTTAEQCSTCYKRVIISKESSIPALIEAAKNFLMQGRKREPT